MIYKGANSIGSDAYFIRLTDNKEYFIHINEDGYIVKLGMIGACIWHEKEGKKFIKESRANNLELVKVQEILTNDGSKN